MTEPNALQKEAQGDWCGFKGAAYHITYAVWVLLTGRAFEVTFYAGNDLLAQPILPPEAIDGDPCGILASGSSTDEWIQVKAHEKPWTPLAVIEDVLGTFVLNALLSEKRLHGWSAKLATTSAVRGRDIAAFVKAPDKFSEGQKFSSKVEQAHREWSAHLRSIGQEDTLPDLGHVRTIALKALSDLAQSQGRSHEFLTKEIELELTARFHDRQTAQQVAQQLSGAVLNALHEGRQPFSLSLNWLERETGRKLHADDLLGTDPLAACNAQIGWARCDSNWTASSCADRPHATEALRQFLRSDRPLFVLSGETDTGKSWFCYNLASNQLSRNVRVLLSGQDLLATQPLAGLVASKFRRWAPTHASDQEIWRQLIGASQVSDRGPLVVIVDDMPVPPDASSFAARLQQLCREAQCEGIKLVLGARPQIWKRVWDSPRLLPYLFMHRAQVPEGSEERYESCILDELTSEEARDILERTVSSRTLIGGLARELREPRLTPLRNPYILSVFVHNVVPQLQPSEAIPTVSVDDLLDKEVDRRLRRTAVRADCDIGEIRSAQSDIISCLWEHRPSGVPGAEMVQSIEAKIPGRGRRVLNALQVEDVLTRSNDPRSLGGEVTYANPQLGDRLTALWLVKRSDTGADLLRGMEPGLDDGVMVAVLRSNLSEALRDQQGGIALAEAALARDPAWLPTVAEGIAQRDSEDWHTLGALTAWANRASAYSTWSAMRALGGMPGRSTRAGYWIAFLYSDEHHRERFKGEVALGRAIDIVPKWVEEELLARLSREVARQPSWESDNQKKAEFLRSALEPLRWVNEADAAEVARSTLTWLKRHYKPRRAEDQLDVREHVYDRVDSIRGIAALYGSQEELKTILDELQDSDGDVRLRAARALVPVAWKRPGVVRSAVMAQAQVESSWLVLLHLVRSLHVYTDDDPDRVLALLGAGGFRSGFGNSGSVLSLLAELALKRPEAVKSALLDLPLSSADAATLLLSPQCRLHSGPERMSERVPAEI